MWRRRLDWSEVSHEASFLTVLEMTESVHSAQPLMWSASNLGSAHVKLTCKLSATSKKYRRVSNQESQESRQSHESSMLNMVWDIESMIGLVWTFPAFCLVLGTGVQVEANP